MGFDSKRYLRDYCRNPVKAQTEAFRGEYSEHLVSVGKHDLLRQPRGIIEPNLLDEWLGEARLSDDDRRAVQEILRRGRAEVKASVEYRLKLSLRAFLEAKARKGNF